MGSLKYKLGAKGNDRVEDIGILKAIHEWGVFSLGISCHHFIFLLARFYIPILFNEQESRRF